MADRPLRCDSERLGAGVSVRRCMIGGGWNIDMTWTSTVPRPDRDQSPFQPSRSAAHGPHICRYKVGRCRTAPWDVPDAWQTMQEIRHIVTPWEPPAASWHCLTASMIPVRTPRFDSSRGPPAERAFKVRVDGTIARTTCAPGGTRAVTSGVEQPPSRISNVSGDDSRHHKQQQQQQHQKQTQK
jgi:hypothetical protein